METATSSEWRTAILENRTGSLEPDLRGQNSSSSPNQRGVWLAPLPASRDFPTKSTEMSNILHGDTMTTRVSTITLLARTFGLKVIRQSFLGFCESLVSMKICLVQKAHPFTFSSETSASSRGPSSPAACLILFVHPCRVSQC